MKKFLKVIFLIILVVVVLGFVFGIIDTLRVHNDEEPIFAFSHKIIDGEDYSAKIDTGLGYKIIRFNYQNLPAQIKVGTIFMSEKVSYTIEENSDLFDNENQELISGDNEESGELETKITTFGEKYTDIIYLEGMEEEVFAQDINSKLGYSMQYFFELFDYTGYEDHDKYDWKFLSGDTKTTMTVYDISNEDAYKEALENITKKDLFEELSGDSMPNVQKLYYRKFKENEIERSNYIYIMSFNELKLMVDLYLPLEAEEGIGMYMRKMVNSITK